GQRILVPPVFQEFPVSSETVPEMQYESARDGAQHHQDDEYNPPRVRPELATLEVPHVREVPVRRGVEAAIMASATTATMYPMASACAPPSHLSRASDAPISASAVLIHAK
ncbi:hypothetical protein THAOC_08961, partial [Thalassiosira oceanica]